MKILIIGGGGREHTIAWKLAQSPLVSEIFISPGNGGTERERKCTNIPPTDHKGLIEFAEINDIDLTVIGPEQPLVEGLADLFRENNLSVIGPGMDAAALEGSKTYAKRFMQKYGVLTARYSEFTSHDKAAAYLDSCSLPIVIKADGLAAGKGVIICNDRKEAEDALTQIMIEKAFGDAGDKVIIEEFLEGKEVSVLALVDGNTILPFISAKDHKQIGDGDKGLNTGGMGVVAPNPWYTADVEKDFTNNILEPTLKGIQAEEWDFRGILFFGVMITSKGCYLLEYNVRMGDPETQAVLPLLKNDLVEVFKKVDSRELAGYSLSFRKGSACTVVAASGGYPEKYKKGFAISFTDQISQPVFISGAEEKKGSLYTTSGRVLSLTAVASNLSEASELVYKEIKNIKFEDMYYRTDIGVVNNE